MVLNPGDLRVAAKTCSAEGCHPTDIHRVKNTLMATNRGIIGTLLYYWGESDSQDTEITVEELIESGRTSFSLDYFRKLCATCHLWKQRYDMPGAPLFFNEKGGGCTACHWEREGDAARENTAIFAADDSVVWTPLSPAERLKRPHGAVTAKVRSSKCIACHNRSGRIGISFAGAFEAEGYGAPYGSSADDVMSENRLPGGRFYLDLADDVHHRAGMECIDCHLREEIMGDGTSYAHYEEQLEIECETCHGGDGKSRKGTPLTNFTRGENGAELRGKVSGKIWRPRRPKRGVCDVSYHRRVSCEACHSSWVPQCYGCHVRHQQGETHLDKLSLVETRGRWVEGRSYIRYEEPMLGVWNDEVVIMTPGCQDMVTVEDDDGQLRATFNRFTMAAINPHTTQAKGRSCQSCHASTKTVGLGEGRLFTGTDGTLQFQPLNQGEQTAAGRTVPLDAWVDLAGRALQHSSRRGIRPFTGNELRSILQVGQCAGCHSSWNDPLWKSWEKKGD